MLTVLAVCFFAFALFLVAHALVFHFVNVRARVRTMVILMTLCGACAWGASPWIAAHLPSSPQATRIAFALSVVLLYTLLWFGYLQFYSAFDTSPSLRFLIEVLESGRPALTADELKKRYDFDDVFRRRVERAASAGYLVVEGSSPRRFRNSVRAQRIGALSSRIKDFLNLGSGG